jgi:hypothetical protein
MHSSKSYVATLSAAIILKNVPRAGSSFPPQHDYQLGLRLGLMPNIVHRFFARCESHSRLDEQNLMSSALIRQHTPPASEIAYSYLYFGHSAGLSPW